MSISFMAVVLIKVLWFGGIPQDDAQNSWYYPPQSRVIATIEPSMGVCIQDGNKWINEGMKNMDNQDIGVDNGEFKCEMITAGGFLIKDDLDSR